MCGLPSRAWERATAAFLPSDVLRSDRNTAPLRSCVYARPWCHPPPQSETGGEGGDWGAVYSTSRCFSCSDVSDVDSFDVAREPPSTNGRMSNTSGYSKRSLIFFRSAVRKSKANLLLNTERGHKRVKRMCAGRWGDEATASVP